MEQSGYSEKVRVFLRMQADPTSVLSLSRQSLSFPPSTLASGLSTPQAEYRADYVFEADESLEYIFNYLCLALDKLHCVLSLGKSDLVRGPHGLIASYIRQIVALQGEITIGCMGFEGDKVTNYLPEAYIPVTTWEEVVLSTQAADLFHCQTAKTALLVFSAFVKWPAGSGGVQFIEASQDSQLLNLLICTVTNANSRVDLRNVQRNRLWDVLRRTICGKSCISVVGNVSSEAWVLQCTAEVMRNRHRSETFFTSSLQRHIERLEVQSDRTRKALIDRDSRQKEEIAALKRDNGLLTQTLNTRKMLKDEDRTMVLRLEQDLNRVKNLHLLRETALNEVKERIKELESDLDIRKYGIATQFRDTIGPFDEKIEELREQNADLERKNGLLEATVSALKACLTPKPRSEAQTQACSRPLSLHFPVPVSISGHRSEKAEIMEEIWAVQREIEGCKQDPAEDQRASQTLYRLLTESWLYTDWALRGLKQAFDHTKAALELEVCDRELKLAVLEHRMSQTQAASTEKWQALESQAATALPLETAMRDLQGKLAFKAEDTLKLKQEFAAAVQKLKGKYKVKLREVKGRESGETEKRVREQCEQLEEKEEQREMERRRAEKERRELQERIATLQDQLRGCP